MFRLIAIFALSTNFAYSQTIPLENIDQQDLESIVQDFSANFHHTSVSSAASLGAIFGFEVGLILGTTTSDKLNDIAQAVDPGTESVDSIPHAGLTLRVSVPLGFTGELTMIPGIDVDDFELDTRSIAIAWDSSMFLNWPITLGFKYVLSDTNMKFTTEVSNVPANAEYDSDTSGLYVYLSKSFIIVEPYIGLGAVKGDGTLSASASIFDGAFTSATSASADETSTHFILGANVDLLFLNLGLEYGRLFDTSKISAKISFGF